MTDPVAERCLTCTGSDEIAAQLPRPTRSASVVFLAERKRGVALVRLFPKVKRVQSW